MDKEIEQIARIKLEPGEVLWIKAPMLTGDFGSGEACKKIVERLQPLFGDNRVLVTPKDVDIKAIVPTN